MYIHVYVEKLHVSNTHSGWVSWCNSSEPFIPRAPPNIFLGRDRNKKPSRGKRGSSWLSVCVSFFTLGTTPDSEAQAPPNILQIYVCIKSSTLSDYLALFRILTTRELVNLFCVCDCCIVGLTRCPPHAPPTRAYVALTLPSPCVDYLIIGFVYGKKAHTNNMYGCVRYLSHCVSPRN